MDVESILNGEIELEVTHISAPSTYDSIYKITTNGNVATVKRIDKLSSGRNDIYDLGFIDFENEIATKPAVEALLLHGIPVELAEKLKTFIEKTFQIGNVKLTLKANESKSFTVKAEGIKLKEHNLNYFYIQRIDRYEGREYARYLFEPNIIRKNIRFITKNPIELAYALLMPNPEFAIQIPNKIDKLRVYIHDNLELLINENYSIFDNLYLFYYDNLKIITLPCNEFVLIDDKTIQYSNGSHLKTIDKRTLIKIFKDRTKITCPWDYSHYPPSKIEVIEKIINVIKNI